MELKGKKIGIAFCGSFCTFDKVFHELEHLKETGAEIYPVFSDAAKGIESRFGKPADFMKKAEEIAGSRSCVSRRRSLSGRKDIWIFWQLFPVRGIRRQSWRTGLRIRRY